VVSNKSGREDGSNPVQDGSEAKSASASRSGAHTGDVGTVLRSAFQATVDETVPDEMLELLRRLT